MPKVSVIIPCYNQGQYIDEAVDSVLAQTYQDFEIIIVNDGSTDELTNKKLENYKKPKTQVIDTANQGPSAARNKGINASNGEYVLPLDADDKIANTYIEQAVKILDGNKNIGIVYCEAEFFGDQSGKWLLPSYNFHEFLSGNQIFCSAFFRRDDYSKTNGYNSNMIDGWEDWDFWLSLIEKGVAVYRIPETLFYYRICKNSRTRKIDIEKEKYLRNILFRNHLKLYVNRYNNPIEINEIRFQITTNVWYYYLGQYPPITIKNLTILFSLFNISLRQKISQFHPEISINNSILNSFKYILKKRLQGIKPQ